MLKIETMAGGFLKYFLPKDKVFYSLFEDASVNLEAIAEEIDSLFEEVSAPSKAKPVVDIAPPSIEDSSNVENLAE